MLGTINWKSADLNNDGRLSAMFRVRLKEVFERTITSDEGGVRSFAMLIGDLNPVHHDAEFATASRFGGLIISGTQSVAYLIAMTATFLAAHGAALGLEYDFNFCKRVRMKAGLGEILSFEASMTILSSGDVAVSGRGKCVLLAAS